MRTMAAGEFKAKCLGVMDEVKAKREPVTITKNGQPIVQLVPLALDAADPIFGFYRGKLEILGDIVSPLYSNEETEEFFGRSAEQMKCS